MAIRRTNKGAQIDMDALMAARPNIPAVGNMKVNAKGDELGANGKVVKRNEDRVREYYRNTDQATVDKASLKGDSPSKKLQPDLGEAVPATAKTAKAEKKAKPKKVQAPVVDEFDDVSQEPLGFKERELPNGDIEMVPYYREEDK